MRIVGEQSLLGLIGTSAPRVSMDVKLFIYLRVLRNMKRGINTNTEKKNIISNMVYFLEPSKIINSPCRLCYEVD